MPIAQRKTDAPVTDIAVSPQVSPETYLGIVADNNNTPVDSLVAYIDGSPWAVTYYGQLIGKHNDLRELDAGQNAAFQQYQRTANLELRVSSPLATSYDADNAITSVNGTAIISYIVPNVHDYFIADAGQRERGLYRIISVERKVFNRNSVYEISYTLVNYITPDSPAMLDLDAKTVRRYRFSKERMVDGLSPIMTEAVYDISVSIAAEYRELMRRYFRTFFNQTYNTLVVPQYDRAIYDAWLVSFLTQIMDSTEVPEAKFLRSISMDHDRYMKQGSLWRVLIDRCEADLPYVHHEVCLAPKTHFNKSSWIKGVAFWNIDYVVYPKEGFTETNTIRDPRPGTYSLYDFSAVPEMETPPRSLANQYTAGVSPVPLIKSVQVDDKYVLSSAFYSGSADLSVLEILVRDYLQCTTLDLKMIQALIAAYPSWPPLERFYYGPLLLLITKEAIKGFY